MGYMFYTLPDGREAGYGVEATCDVEGCEKTVWRGYDALCGESPEGRREANEYGCGFYFCSAHESDHGCVNPACSVHSYDGYGYCELPKGHPLPHLDVDYGEEFTKTEEDEEDDE